MVQSLLVYGFLGLSLWGLGKIAAYRERLCYRQGRKTNFFTWEITIALLLFALISGIRWNVGTDHLGYLNTYQSLKEGIDFKRDDFESGFTFITMLFAKLNIHFTVYFGFLAFLQLFLVYYAFKDERFILPYLGLIILFGGQYLLWMNGIRQALAACFFVYSIQFITQRKLIKYIVVIFIATLLHKSAVILFIFYFIPNKEYFKNRAIATGLLIATIFVGLNPFWMSATDSISNIFNTIGYADRYDLSTLEYIISERQRDMNFGPRRIAANILCVLIIWYYPKIKKHYNNNNKIRWFYNLAILGALHHNLFANTTSLFLRPTYYLTIFTPIVISYLLSYLNSKEYKKFSPSFMFIFIVSISYLIFAIFADSGKVNQDFTNYKFFWDYYISL